MINRAVFIEMAIVSSKKSLYGSQHEYIYIYIYIYLYIYIYILYIYIYIYIYSFSRNFTQNKRFNVDVPILADVCML